MNTHITDNPNIPNPIADSILQSWIRKMYQNVWWPICINGVFASILQLSELFGLPRHNIFKYIQHLCIFYTLYISNKYN